MTAISAELDYDAGHNCCLFVRFDDGRRAVIYTDNQKFVRYGVPVVNLGPDFEDLPEVVLEPDEYPVLDLKRPWQIKSALRDEALAGLVRHFLELTDAVQFKPGPLAI